TFVEMALDRIALHDRRVAAHIVDDRVLFRAPHLRVCSKVPRCSAPPQTLLAFCQPGGDALALQRVAATDVRVATGGVVRELQRLGARRWVEPGRACEPDTRP